jgi:O-antigen/teichoic acid export membrane protein
MKVGAAKSGRWRSRRIEVLCEYAVRLSEYPAQLHKYPAWLWRHSRELARKPLLRNALWMFSGQGLSLLAQAGYFIVIARLLGSTQYGLLAGAAASVGLLSQYGAFGSGLLFLRHVSPDHSKFREYWGNILMSCLTLGTALVVLLRFTAPLFLRDIDVRVIVLLAIGDCICGQLATATSQVFQAFERMRYTAMLNTAVSCSRMVLAIAMLMTLHRATALQWARASLAISALTAIGGVAVVTMQFGLPRFRLRLFGQRLWEGFIFAVSGSTTSVYNDVDKAMLAHYGMNAANGIYTMAYRVIDVSAMPIRSIHAAAFPRFFRHGAEPGGLRSTEQFARRLLRRTSVLGLAVAVCLFVGAPVIPMLTGKGFAPSVMALRWLCLIPFFRGFHLSAGDALAGAGRQATRLVFQTVAALGNLGMNLYLIPRYSWRGAALASLITDAGLGVMLWIVLGWLKHRMRDRSIASAVLQPQGG